MQIFNYFCVSHRLKMAEMNSSATKRPFFALLKTACGKFVGSRENGLIGRQRLAVYIYSSLMLLIGIPLSLLGLLGPVGGVFAILNGCHLLLTILLLAGYLMRRIPLAWALGVLILGTQTVISAEMIHCATDPTDYHRMLIVADMALSAITIMLTLVAYLPRAAYLLCGISLATYLACAWLTVSPSMWNFFGIFALVFLLMALLGGRLMRNIRVLEQENELLQREEYAMMEVLKLNKRQMMALAELAQGQADERRTAELLDSVGPEVRRRLDASIARQMKHERTHREQMERIFPELTPSERDISRLILQDKKLAEMCSMLGKNRGNITSQRAHIREKLGLDKSDNLKAALLKRLNQ